MRVYDYVDREGVNQVEAWARGLDPRSRAKFDNKIRLVQQADMDSLPGLVRGFNIQGQRHIGKLAVGSSGSGRALRPLICRGPIDSEEEITILLGAEERDRKLPDGIAKIVSLDDKRF